LSRIEGRHGIFILHAPFDLHIYKINQDLVKEPTLINQGAESQWIAEFDLKDKNFINGLLSEEDYLSFISTK
jgi:glycine cleavage system H lipoate-binding protein